MQKSILFTILIFLSFGAFAQLPMKSEADLEAYPTYRKFKAPVDSVYKMCIENPKELPSDFDKYIHLQKLCLFGNDWDYDFYQLPGYFYTFENLTDLSIANTDLQNLGKNISKFENLQRLSVANNNLIALPPDLSKCEDLLSLTIDNNIKKIPELKNLTDLVIYFETNLGDDSGTIPQGISDCRKLKSLSIYSEVTLINIPEMISIIRALPVLEKLTFIDPNLDDEYLVELSGIKKITEINLPSIQIKPETMAGFGHLKHLSFGKYLEDDQGVRANFWQQIISFKDLEDVTTRCRVGDSNFYGQLKKLNLIIEMEGGLQEQFDVIKDLTCLNRIDMPRTSTLPRNMTELSTLKEIDLTDLYSVDFSIVFGYLMVLPSLEKIIVSNDQFTTFPQETVKLVHLKEMVIYNIEHGAYPPISDSEKKRARKLLPNCKFVYHEMF